MDSQPVVFRTKVDLWLVAILVGSLGFALWAGIDSVRRDPASGWFPLLIVVGSFAVVFVISVPTEYVVTGTELVIRSGRLRTSIPLTGIQRVYRTHNPLSAPAWSLDRLGIDYRSGGQRRLALISPARREEFLTVVGQRAGLEHRGSELTRPVGTTA